MVISKKIVFFRISNILATRSHAQLIFSAQSLKSYEHFSDLGVKIALSHRHVEKRLFFSGKTNYSMDNSIHPTLYIRTEQTSRACFSLIRLLRQLSTDFHEIV